MSSAAPATRRIAIVTGSRADFGLLVPVIHAIEQHPALDRLVIAAGSHLIAPALTFRDVKALFPVADSIPMQVAGATGRFADVAAVGKGISRFARSYESLSPDWVVVLGDRIEAFAAAAAASIAGIALAHIHGGDRAEGVADEAMRHSISKLAHLHLAATESSAERLRRMGEKPQHVLTVGSPAIDGLDAIEPLDDVHWLQLGNPTAVLIFHPIGRSNDAEAAAMRSILQSLADERLLVLHPNHDPGRDGIMHAIREDTHPAIFAEHISRPHFLAMLKRLAASGGLLVGNSSAGLIEAAALRCPVVNIGHRQAGRERPANVIDVPDEDASAIRAALARARALPRADLSHPFGDGHAAERIAAALADFDPKAPAFLRKHNTY